MQEIVEKYFDRDAWKPFTSYGAVSLLPAY